MATSLEALPPNSAGLASCCASPGKAAITSGFVMPQRTERQTGGGSVVVVVGGSVVVGAALGGATVARAAGGASLPLHDARPAATARHPTTRRRRFRVAVMTLLGMGAPRTLTRRYGPIPAAGEREELTLTRGVDHSISPRWTSSRPTASAGWWPARWIVSSTP